MSYQGKSSQQKIVQKQSHLGMSAEGLIELDDEQLESIAGGHTPGSPAEAQLRHDQGVLAALQIEAASHPTSIRNTNNVNGNVISNSQSVGQGSITNKHK